MITYWGLAQAYREHGKSGKILEVQDSLQYKHHCGGGRDKRKEEREPSTEGGVPQWRRGFITGSYRRDDDGKGDGCQLEKAQEQREVDTEFDKEESCEQYMLMKVPPCAKDL